MFSFRSNVCHFPTFFLVVGGGRWRQESNTRPPSQMQPAQEPLPSCSHHCRPLALPSFPARPASSLGLQAASLLSGGRPLRPAPSLLLRRPSSLPGPPGAVPHSGLPLLPTRPPPCVLRRPSSPPGPLPASQKAVLSPGPTWGCASLWPLFTTSDTTLILRTKKAFSFGKALHPEWSIFNRPALLLCHPSV